MSDRLLFIAPWFLFPTVSGGRIRSVDVLRGMRGKGFEITLVSPEPGDGRDWSAELATVCDRWVGWADDTDRGAFARSKNLLSRLPVSVALDQSPAARALVAAELAKAPDLAVVDFVHTAVLLPETVAVPLVCFTHNVESEIYARHAEVTHNPIMKLVWRRQSKKMAKFEGDVLRRFDSVVAVSERDRASLADLFGIKNARVIPTGVDLEAHPFAVLKPEGDLRDTGAVIVFTGSMNWRPNIEGLEWFLDEVWPDIAIASPKTRVLVVGRDPDPRLVRRCERARVPWSFTGFVDRVQPHIDEGDVFVIPLRVGGGTRLKAFEAMALGVPVVSTTIGVEGLPLLPETHYIRGDTPVDFADAVLRLVRDGDLREALRHRAREHVASQFGSEAVARVFERICREAMSE